MIQFSHLISILILIIPVNLWLNLIHNPNPKSCSPKQKIVRYLILFAHYCSKNSYFRYLNPLSRTRKTHFCTWAALFCVQKVLYCYFGVLYSLQKVLCWYFWVFYRVRKVFRCYFGVLFSLRKVHRFVWAIHFSVRKVFCRIYGVLLFAKKVIR